MASQEPQAGKTEDDTAKEGEQDGKMEWDIERGGKSAQDRHRYDDIINLPRHISKLHSPMPVADRAAQFMPFAALTGFEGALRETGRLTDAEPRLAEDATEGLDGKLQYLRERIGEHPEISVTYFQPDARKAGGAFVTAGGRIRKIDFYERVLVMEDGMAVPMKAVVGLEGEIFSGLEG